ncbi:MAG TPA: ATP-binding protein [Bacilli bacterium]|nr:ATP-binding protein [Bacilli bacterium]
MRPELKRKSNNVDVGVVNNQGKSVLKSAEVDFVCNQADVRLYIQAVYTIEGEEKLKQEQKFLLNISDAFKKIVIVKDSTRAHYNQDGVYILGYMTFY